MKFKLPQEVQTILDKFSNANYQIYIVGGAVRDLLMGKKVSDWDFTTDAKPEEILKLFPDGFYDNKFGTVGITMESARGGGERVARRQAPEQQVYEITTMRRESDYQDFRHPDKIKWTDKIVEDLGRRDFTINAMALNPDNQIIDPFKGQQDLEKKLIKSVNSPKVRFTEDGLRLIRAVRFSTQLGFKIEENTLKAVKENAYLITKISWERIRDELLKILASNHPHEEVSLLKDTGLLESILPEVTKCFGIVQEGPKHDRIYDIGEHSFLSLKLCPSTDPLVRLAALIHDIGKPDTMAIQPDGNVTFYGHDVVGGRLAKNVAERLKLSNKQTDKLVKLVRWHLFTVDENQTDSAIRRFIKNVGLENIADMMDLRVGDRLGGGTQKAVSWRMEEFRKRIDQVLEQPFSVIDLKVSGHDVMKILGIKPGKKVGEVLNQLFQEVSEDPEKNTREYLLKRIKQIT